MSESENIKGHKVLTEDPPRPHAGYVKTYHKADGMYRITSDNTIEKIGSDASAITLRNSSVDTVNYVIDNGLLYNFYTIANSNGLAPTGWTVPTVSEMQNLRTIAGGDNVAGGNLKGTHINTWSNPGFVHGDPFNFAAYSTAQVQTGTGGFAGPLDGLNGYYWTSTDYGGGPNFIKIYYNSDYFGIGNALSKYGHAIRLCRDLQGTENALADGSFCNDMVDYDGNRYRTIKIGTKVWIHSNLKVKHYRNGTPILDLSNSSQWDSNTTGAYWNTLNMKYSPWTEDVLLAELNTKLVNPISVYGSEKYAKKLILSFIGNGGTSWTISHNLNTRNIMCQVINDSTYTNVDVTITRTSVNAIQITSGAALTGNFTVLLTVL